MKIAYTLHEITFEWDSSKAAANLKNHHISFEKACEAFFDPFFKPEEGGVFESEVRHAIIGLTLDWRLLFIVYVMRGDAVRIISAREATKPERKLYEDQ